MLNRATAAWTLRVIRTAAPRLLAVLVALTLLQGLLPAALAMALRGLINAAAAGAAVDVSSQLLGWVALAFVLTAADALTGLAVGYAGQRLTDDLNLHLTGEILAHAWSLDLAFFEDPERQDLLARTQANVGVQLQGLVLEALNVLRQLLTAVALLLVLAAVEPLVVLVVPPFAIPFLYFQWRLAKHRHAEQQQRATNLRWTSYFVSKLTAPESVAEVKLLDLGPLLIERFRRLHGEFRDRDRLLHLRNFRGTSLAALLAIGALCALFARVATRAAAGVVSLGDLAIFGGAAIRLRFALNDVIRSGVGCLERLMSLGNLREFLEVRPAVTTGKGLTPALDRGAVEIRDVTFAYPGGSAPVLRGLSLSIRPGETLALVGESGAGKSTLVKLLARLYDPDEGQILFDGVDLRDIAPAHLHQRIGLVLQSFGRYEASAAENIAYGDWRRLLERRDEVERLAPGGESARDDRESAAGVRHPSGPGLRHDDPVGGRVAAGRHGPCLRAAGVAPHPGRAHRASRRARRVRAVHPVQGAVARAHDAADLPPLHHDRPGRPDRSAGGRPGGRAGRPSRAARPAGGLRVALPVCTSGSAPEAPAVVGATRA